MTGLTGPSATIVGSAAWGFLEATVFFVVPDVLVGLVALFAPRRALGAWLAAVVGAVVGAATVSAAMRRFGWDPEPIFGSLPGIRRSDIVTAHEAVVSNAVRAFASGPSQGIPVKIFVAEATRLGLPIERILALVVVNRAPRIGAFAAAMALLGLLGRPAVERRPRAVVAVYGFIWAGFYAWFLGLRRERQAPR